MNLIELDTPRSYLTYSTVIDYLQAQDRQLSMVLHAHGIEDPSLYDVMSAHAFFAMDLGVKRLGKEDLEKLQRDFMDMGAFIKETLNEEYPEEKPTKKKGRK